MAMSELKQKLMLRELTIAGFPHAEYNPASDMIHIQPDTPRMPRIYDDGSVTHGAEYSDLAVNRIKPLADRVTESVAAWDNSRNMPVEGLARFRALAEFNGVILAARDDTDSGRGLHFATWKYDYNRTGLEYGHYTEDYNAAKEDFALRSGFIPEEKLLTQEQVSDIKAALEYRMANDGSLTYEAEYALHLTVERLRTAYPGLDADESHAAEVPDKTLAADTAKPRTLAEKMQAASEKVKAQDAQGGSTKSHKREERE
jgi:hypothetical protein